MLGIKDTVGLGFDFQQVEQQVRQRTPLQTQLLSLEFRTAPLLYADCVEASVVLEPTPHVSGS